MRPQAAAATIMPLPMPTSKPTSRTVDRADPIADAALGDSLRDLARRGVVRSYRKGTLLIQEGDQGDTLYIILEGRLRSFSTGGNDREITYGTYGPGEYLGEMSLDGGPRSASVETLQASTCAVVTRSTLMSYIGEHPEFAFELLSKVIRRARAATLSAKQMAVNDVYGRVKLLLESGVEGTGADSPPTQRLTHQMIASSVGCSREMVGRVMKDLLEGGFVRADDHRWVILKPLPTRW